MPAKKPDRVRLSLQLSSMLDQPKEVVTTFPAVLRLVDHYVKRNGLLESTGKIRPSPALALVAGTVRALTPKQLQAKLKQNTKRLRLRQ